MKEVTEMRRQSYKAAGVLPFAFDRDGNMLVLLSRRVPKEEASKRQMMRCDAFNFLGGKRQRTDLGPEDTALREVYEETAGLISSAPGDLKTAVWMQSSKYLVYLVHMPAHRDLPLVFALWRAQGRSCWGGISTLELRWLPLQGLLDPSLDPSWKQHPVVRIFLQDTAPVRWLQRREREQTKLVRSVVGEGPSCKSRQQASGGSPSRFGHHAAGRPPPALAAAARQHVRQSPLPWQKPKGPAGADSAAEVNAAEHTSLWRPWLQQWQGKPLRVKAIAPPAPGPRILPLAWWLAPKPKPEPEVPAAAKRKSMAAAAAPAKQQVRAAPGTGSYKTKKRNRLKHKRRRMLAKERRLQKQQAAGRTQ